MQSLHTLGSLSSHSRQFVAVHTMHDTHSHISIAFITTYEAGDNRTARFLQQSWPLDWPRAISYRCSVGTDTIPKAFRDVEAQMHLGYGLDRLLCIHVTSSVTWSFFPRYVVSYRRSIDTNLLSWAVCKILSLKHIWTATLTFRVTRYHFVWKSVENPTSPHPDLVPPSSKKLVPPLLRCVTPVLSLKTTKILLAK